MAYLTQDQIAELSTDQLVGQSIAAVRPRSKQILQLIELTKAGLKGVVWRGSDDIGNPLAVKLVPAGEYAEQSVIDEATEAQKLGGRYFARIRAFGDLESPDIPLAQHYKVVATDWVEGQELSDFLNTFPLSVDDFISLAHHLCTALAILRRANLCHDDLHPGNVLLFSAENPLTGERELSLKVIDTGTIKRLETRQKLLQSLRDRVVSLQAEQPDSQELADCLKLLKWKEPDDHLRAMECLLHAANALVRSYPRADIWERRFIDGLAHFFDRATDDDVARRLDTPIALIDELAALMKGSRRDSEYQHAAVFAPFDYISAEMIHGDREFAELFSRECPWLADCTVLEPLYVYGPRGCGKSSVLRWISFKTRLATAAPAEIEASREIGVYVSCSVELRSRFWLFSEEAILRHQTSIVLFFSLLLLEGLFDTLEAMQAAESSQDITFGIRESDLRHLSEWFIERLGAIAGSLPARIEGQPRLSYLRGASRKLRWQTWSRIRSDKDPGDLPDASLVSDVCREVRSAIPFFEHRQVTFLIDDYSNQRIPRLLQKKLNQTISFAKQGTPLFKVTSEYHGVELEGIEEGREVVELNVGARYTTLVEGGDNQAFLSDILNLRLKKAGFKGTIEEVLGHSDYGSNMASAIAGETGDAPFYYFGLDTINLLCSGDVALAIELIRSIYSAGHVAASSHAMIPPHIQHKAIQEFSHQSIKRIKHIVPYGAEMYDLVVHLGSLARVFVSTKRSGRKDKRGEPVAKTHLDIRTEALRELEENGGKALEIYRMATSRAILFTLETSRSRISGATERLQMRRVYFPAFKAAIKRDVPIKVDSGDELQSLLLRPKLFCERELQRSGIDSKQLQLALADLEAP